MKASLLRSKLTKYPNLQGNNNTAVVVDQQKRTTSITQSQKFKERIYSHFTETTFLLFFISGKMSLKMSKDRHEEGKRRETIARGGRHTLVDANKIDYKLL